MGFTDLRFFSVGLRLSSEEVQSCVDAAARRTGVDATSLAVPEQHADEEEEEEEDDEDDMSESYAEMGRRVRFMDQRRPATGPHVTGRTHRARLARLARRAHVGDAVPDFVTPRKDLDPESDECPVCYAALLDTRVGVNTNDMQRRVIRWCPDCRNAVHRDCVERWLATSPLPSCVMCRSTAWDEWDHR